MEIHDGDYIIGFWSVGGSGKSDWLATVLRRGDKWMIESRLHDYANNERAVSSFTVPVDEVSEEQMLKKMAKSAWEVTERFPDEVGTQVEFGRVQSTDVNIFVKRLEEAKHLKMRVVKTEKGSEFVSGNRQSDGTVVFPEPKPEPPKPEQAVQLPPDLELGPEPPAEDERGRLIWRVKALFAPMLALEGDIEGRNKFFERLKTEKLEMLRAMVEGGENILAAQNLLGPEASRKALEDAMAKMKELGWEKI